ncbi:adhesin biosynthesis transcription regulatory family protein [Escherichia coli]|uniref:adhesin biosynthesis transcription regulatory family protein n=1 Tax=Escherichia coli TaxID=562 RepID=UPI0028E480D1|nr:adhesin biosynthesis transcription regulatory family protein [Escherichia coli]WNU18213.1 adhesin biosynthesis transcription regulatory family protein [Escherichia coli]
MAHHEVISRSGNAFLLNIRESVLLPGSMSEMHFFLLIGISSIHSDRVILAMKDYLVGGHSRKEVCEKYQMNNGYFSTTLGRLRAYPNRVLFQTMTPQAKCSIAS